MGAEKVFGRTKKEVKEVLERLGIKEGKPIEEIVLEQGFIDIPRVGEVTLRRLYADGEVRKKSERMINLSGTAHELAVSNISWYQAMLLARSLGLELLSNKEYWKSFKWLLENKEDYQKAIESRMFSPTWTKTLVVWDREAKAAEHLLETHNYKGKLPVIVEGPKVVKDKGFPDGYRIEGGKLVVPKKALAVNEGRFEFSDVEKDAWLPCSIDKEGLVRLLPNRTGSIKAIVCDACHLYADLGLDHTGNIGMFCKKPSPRKVF